MKVYIMAALLATAPLAAHAETFTYTSTAKAIDAVMLPPAAPGSRPEGAQVFSISTETLFADGKTLHSAGKCSSWVLPPDARFGSSGVCQYTDAAGPLYTVQFSCEPPQKGGTGVNCWGRLVGQGGEWKGHDGAFGFRNGAAGVSHDAGQWN